MPSIEIEDQVELNTHIIVINYIAKLEHENSRLKAKIARLTKELFDDLNTYEGC